MKYLFRLHLRCAAACTLLLIFTPLATAARPNIVILLADDLGSKDIGCYGGPVKTPNLDELAASGVRLTNFYSGAPVCSTARATLLTGRHHVRTGVYTVIQDHLHDMHLLRSEVTLAEILKKNGYDTAHIGKWHLGTPFRGRDKPWVDEHGFDYWFATDLNSAPSHRDPRNFWKNRERVGELKGYACQLVVDEAISWLDTQHGEDKPFFLNIWFHEPHAPLAAPAEIVSEYGKPNDQAAIYSATIDNTDRAIGRLLKKLEKLGVADNTIIVYTSDHGSYRPERNGDLKGSKGSLYEGGLRVPGIVSWPKQIPAGGVLNTPAGHIDLLPTLCGLCEVDKPKGVQLDGLDLSSLWSGDSDEERRTQPITWHSPCSQPVVGVRDNDYSLVGFRANEFPKDQETIAAVMKKMRVIMEQELDRKLTQGELLHQCWNSESKRPDWLKLRNEFVHLNAFQESWTSIIKEGSGGISRWELYDLSADPNQKKNLAKDQPEILARLKAHALKVNGNVLKEGPLWSPKSEPNLTTAKRSAIPTAARPSPDENAADAELRKLLAKIETTDLPESYHGSTHQEYVDKRMAGMTEQQRGRLGRMWKDKRRLEPKMKNVGASFVRILEFVATDGAPQKKPSAKPMKKPARVTERIGEAGPVPPLRDTPDPVNVGPIDRGGNNWHHWRGPEVTGVSRTANPPLEWSEDRNIKWKVAVEGQGNATPIVWGGKVFVLTAIDTGRVDPALPKPEDQPDRVFGIKYPNTFYKFDVVCLNRNTGAGLWRQTASEHVPHEGTHRDADFASASPTTDGKRLYCWFGSAGLYCYDLDGKKLWQRDLGKAYIGASLGEGCSPVIHNDRLIIVRDQARQSTIEVLNAADGETVWKKDRDEPNAWSTPRVIEHNGATQVITTASKMIRSYDLATGEIIWQCKGLTGNCTPCPVVDGQLVLCMSGYEGHSLMAVPLDSKGDISESESIAWTRDKGTPYVPSPVLYDGLLYHTQSNQGILTVVDSQTGGTVLDRTRLPGISNLYSSPVGAAGRIYFTGRNGATVVLKRSREFEVLANNKLDDEINASPAMAGSQLFLRGRKWLYCIEDASVAAADDKAGKSMEEKTRIHRLASTKRSVFDAFTYINRIPDEPEDGESTADFSGRIFSLLANQEGRILLKAPPGMTLAAYEGFKAFIRTEGDQSVGNCIACHTLPGFSDGPSQVTAKAANPAPSLRNLSNRRIATEQIIREKISASPNDSNNAYAALKLSDRDIGNVASFLTLLEDVSNERFRELIIKATVMDTSGIMNE
ncbi:MAG: sulfatase-like hydrolase/transferase [Fuerstiella sp.]